MKNLFITVFIAVILISCGTENNPTYTLTTTVSPPERGTISPSSGEYSEGEVVELTGTPTSDGWRFVRWEGDWSSTQNPSSVTMNRDYSVVGVFERRNYPLTITIKGEGSVAERVIPQKTTEYPYETMVELTPIPSDDWLFFEWDGDLSGDESPEEITVDGDKSITATFVQGELRTNTYRYDSSNNQIELISYGSDGTVNSRTSFNYDSSNNLVESIRYEADGSVNSRNTYSYDENNNRIELNSYDSGGLLMSRWTYSYDSNNNVVEEIRFDSNDLVNSRLQFTYDSSSNLIERIRFDSAGTIIDRTTFTYDSESNLIESIVYNSDNSIRNRVTYNYDTNNNRIEQITYNADGALSSRRINNYDSDNNLIGYTTFNSDGVVTIRVKAEYDSNNNLTRVISLFILNFPNKVIDETLPNHNEEPISIYDCFDLDLVNHQCVKNHMASSKRIRNPLFE